MAEKKFHKPGSEQGAIIHVNLLGAIVFSIALVVAAALITYGITRPHESARSETSSINPDSVVRSAEIPPWGQLLTRDIDLEQPEEYVAFETTTNQTERWTFEKMPPDQVRSAMEASGIPGNEIARALSPAMMTTDGNNTVIQPDEELVFSFDASSRAKLFNVLARFDSNQFMRFPFCFRSNSVDAWFGGKVSPQTVGLLKQLAYKRGETTCFSDFEILLKKLPGEAERLRFVKALSRQSAVLLRIQVWPDTDVDKIIGYWSLPGSARMVDVRPLLESLKRLPDGGSMSLLYFLPKFARERLYTYPLPSKLGDPTIDCHWSTMNFFNDPPDNRFSSPTYIADFLSTNYYRIAKPTTYGDVILLMDSQNHAIHSAVYLADDIVFTKNGNNFAQPWMLMRLKDLVGEYTTDTAPALAIYRNKTR